MSNFLSKLVMALKMANYHRLRKRREPQRIAYRQWVLENDTINESKRLALQALDRQLPRRPLISVIMPVYNAPLNWLDAAIESVRQQIYQDWELCIADDRSTNPEVATYLRSKASQDPRIRIDFRAANGHISAASNSAIALASGEFIALMDQDDLMPANALLAVANAINAHPDAGLIYTDEDKIDELGQRESPTRKGEWDIKSLQTLNRVSHLGVYRTSLVRQIGGFRVGYEGAQDHDLVLRCVEQLRDEQIIYIPEILYHWRIHAQSTAHMRTSKPYAATARIKALQDHATRMAERNR
ncbi:MAG: glycosyltransferase [Rubrivivax sp.]|nr:MAG: glycosyltransferase [Rubrivivax sp.]